MSNLTKQNQTPQILLFSPDATMLYFTSPLNTSIHAFSLLTNVLLPQTHPHLSAPTVLALSRNGDVLVSASASPPIVLIQDLRIAGLAAAELRDVNSASAVTCAAFEARDTMTRESIRLVLGFRDGTVTMHRVHLPAVAEYQSPPHGCHVHIQTTVLGILDKMHRAAMGGVSAAAFLPGCRSRVVTIGHDGRCRLIDFEGAGRLLRTWHVESPATALSVTTSRAFMSEAREHSTTLLQHGSAQAHDRTDEATETRIAVGTQAGKIMLFNALGILLHETNVEEPVVSVQWVGDMSAPSTFVSRDLSSISEMSPVILSLMKQIGEIEDKDQVLLSAEQTVDLKGREEVPRRSTVSQPINSFTDAHRDCIISAQQEQQHINTRHPYMQAQTPLPERHTNTSLPLTRPFRTSLVKDPMVRTGRAMRNIRKQRRVGSNSRLRECRSKLARGESQKMPIFRKCQTQTALSTARNRPSRNKRSACCSSTPEQSAEKEFFTPPLTRWPSLRDQGWKRKSGAMNSGSRHEMVHEETVEGGDVEFMMSGAISSELLRKGDLKREKSPEYSAGGLEQGAIERSQFVTSAGPPFRVMSVNTNSPSSPRSHDQTLTSDVATNRLESGGNVGPQVETPNKTKRLRYVSPTPLASPSISHEYSSSLYSQTSAQAFRGASAALDGGIDNSTSMALSPLHIPKKRLISEDEPYDLKAPDEQRLVAKARTGRSSADVRREGFSRLHNDTEALKVQLCGLRDEFQVLKEVLLRGESERRWKECVT